jgi:hypothetical protein
LGCKDNLKVKAIKVTKNGKTHFYTQTTPEGKIALEEGQKQFDVYLKNILDSKLNEALEDIK